MVQRFSATYNSVAKPNSVTSSYRRYNMDRNMTAKCFVNYTNIIALIAQLTLKLIKLTLLFFFNMK